MPLGWDPAERTCFDPLFFNISPREAESMSPHQRLILQESWRSLEDAGYNPKDLADTRVGVFIGAEPAEYFHETFTGASDAIVASRLSYYLDLKGPAMVVNTGCSSSAVALHLACESLRHGESSLALAGGVFVATEANPCWRSSLPWTCSAPRAGVIALMAAATAWSSRRGGHGRA